MIKIVAAVLALFLAANPAFAQQRLLNIFNWSDYIDARLIDEFERAYWSRLWSNFRREDEADLRNALLNYGYAVLRACVARALVGMGFLPAFGIHHASVTNAFNLADDMLEPFRPFIDLLVWRRLGGKDEARAMSLEDRQSMAGAMMENATMGEDEVTLLVAAERLAASLARAMEERRPEALLLPRLVT